MPPGGDNAWLGGDLGRELKGAEDPAAVFADPAARDYRLKPGSRAIGAGAPIPERNLDGTRIDPASLPGGMADLGCFTAGAEPWPVGCRLP